MCGQWNFHRSKNYICYLQKCAANGKWHARGISGVLGDMDTSVLIDPATVASCQRALFLSTVTGIRTVWTSYHDSSQEMFLNEAPMNSEKFSSLASYPFDLSAVSFCFYVQFDTTDLFSLWLFIWVLIITDILRFTVLLPGVDGLDNASASRWFTYWYNVLYQNYSPVVLFAETPASSWCQTDSRSSVKCDNLF